MNAAECLDEVALLLGGSGHRACVEVLLMEEAGGRAALQIEADRPRLSHALLRRCSDGEGMIKLSASSEDTDVRIDVQHSQADGATSSFSAEDFRQLIEQAGGVLTLSPGRASLRFRRVAPSAS